MTTLVQEHDCLLLDLDGTVFRGHEPTPGAVDTLAAVTARTLYVTNNASRGPGEVAQHLRAMGFTATPDDVVTSAQSAAHLLAERLPSGAPVLIVGTESLAAEIRNVGLETRPVVVGRPDGRRAGSFTRDRVAQPGRGSPGDQGRCAVGSGKRRPDAAVRTGSAARKRLDGRSIADGDRPRADGRGQAATNPADGCIVARQLSVAVGRR